MGLADLRRDGCLAAATAAVVTLMLVAVGNGAAGSARTTSPRALAHSRTVARDHVVTGTVMRAATSTIDTTLQSRIRTRLANATARGVAAVVDVAGVGRVASINAWRRSRPASTQKLFTTIPVLEAMPGRTLVTEVRAPRKPVDGVLHGNLFVTASRDPSLTRSALRGLAAQVRQTGLRRVTGKLKVDIGSMSLDTRRYGWKSQSVPWDIGPLSPFPVGEDWWRHDSAYLSHPTASNAELFRQMLRDAGVRVSGGVAVVRSGSASVVVASRTSKPLSDLVRHALVYSDNFYAESMLLIEHPWRVHDLVKTAAIGDSYATDGSGLSYLDRESPHGEVKLLHYVRRTSAGDMLLKSLPVGCRSGTLIDRFCGTIGAGKVWAKTGTLSHDRALSGFTVDARGRLVTFSILCRGVRDLTAAARAIDRSVLLMRRYNGG